MSPDRHGTKRLLRPDTLGPRQRYQLLTSLVVPRPIAWVSTRGPDGVPNLAPYSFFSAVSATPMIVTVSMGRRKGRPKDSLRNVVDRRAFCVNVVTEGHLEAMNLTSAGFEPHVDEFEQAGLALADDAAVDAPYVAGAAAVLECELLDAMELPESSNTLVLGRVVGVRLAEDVELVGETLYADTRSLAPVARLWGGTYGLLGEILHVPRPG